MYSYLTCSDSSDSFRRTVRLVYDFGRFAERRYTMSDHTSRVPPPLPGTHRPPPTSLRAARLPSRSGSPLRVVLAVTGVNGGGIRLTLTGPA